MIVYKFRPDMVYDGPVEMPDAPSIPKYHTFQAPPTAPEGSYVIMSGGWHVVQGVPPVYPPPPIPPSIDQIKQEITKQTQNRLDNFAQTRNYDNVLSACTYASSPTLKFSVEGQYCVQARDATWASLYNIMYEVESGIRPMPSNYNEIESELPILVWPN